MNETCQRAAAHSELDTLRQPLEQLLARLSSVTLALLGDLMQGKVAQALANSALYLNSFGHAVIGWRWLEQAIRAQEGLANGNPADSSTKANCRRPLLPHLGSARRPPRPGHPRSPRRHLPGHASRLVLSPTGPFTPRAHAGLFYGLLSSEFKRIYR